VSRVLPISRAHLQGLPGQLEGDGALAEQGLALVEGVHAHRTRTLRPGLRGGQRVGVALAGHHQLRAELPDALYLGRGGHGGYEDPGRHAALLAPRTHPGRGVGHGHAVVAAGSRHDSRGRHVPQQQVRERAADLERPGALQLFQLERDGRQTGALRVELAEVDLNHWRPPDERPDRLVGAADVVTGDHICQHT
jgi:hypothetical protein